MTMLSMQEPPQVAIVMVGLPQAGKSSIANCLGLPIVCPDDLRFAITGKAWVKEAEPTVWATATYMARGLLRRHPIIIIDATHSQEYEREKWVKEGFDCRYICVDTDPGTCRQRAETNGKGYLLDVIDKQYKRFEYRGVPTDTTKRISFDVEDTPGPDMAKAVFDRFELHRFTTPAYVPL